ncbi:ABC-type sugar transport system permease subunit [Rhodobium orientis]|uniref:ABC transporter permease n=1 Tax=Rhodobium orientis TaxID=34017 RepID=A0A327JRZ6_9HYPH|nr:sugar ABC transporter permease [Rhodobium orientis]MBB4303533.1 ABC-type sugar transport system permease subunit [Rhodobium orientis]MBK5950463.1 ABC transporter permease [Rhodobium orientis]RAI28316.1 ABC transporter permease [Rhodobium orientis]
MSSTSFERRRRRAGLLFVAPAAIVLLAILAYPIVESFILSTQSVRLVAGGVTKEWNSFANYIRLAGDETFRRAVVNTMIFSFGEVALVVSIGLAVALLLNHPLGRWGFFRIMLVVPWAIAPVANAVLWKWILNSNYGILNGLLKSLGLIEYYQVWLARPWSAFGFLLLIDVWKSVPFIALLLLAGLQRVPQSLYKAAYMDGAGRWQAFRHVTLPTMRSALAIAVVLQTIWSLRVFEIIFVLTRGGPADATVLMNFLAYRVTFNFLDIGYGAAIANIIFALTFLLAITYVWLMQPRKRRISS